MKELLLSPKMGYVEYPSKLQATSLPAELICIFGKMNMKENCERQVPPTSFYLRLENSEDAVEVTDLFNANSGFSASFLACLGNKKEEQRKKFHERLYLVGDEEDTDTMKCSQTHIYPPQSLIKTIIVDVTFTGLDINGRAVWQIVLNERQKS